MTLIYTEPEMSFDKIQCYTFPYSSFYQNSWSIFFRRIVGQSCSILNWLKRTCRVRTGRAELARI